ncbi:MAG: hypothetical protein K2W82_16750 [Candidatus Obscuribacterales bacterium]|nr:hypothetical protein [Candidatus Obscuribacterales bacterium]
MSFNKLSRIQKDNLMSSPNSFVFTNLRLHTEKGCLVNVQAIFSLGKETPQPATPAANWLVNEWQHSVERQQAYRLMIAEGLQQMRDKLRIANIEFTDGGDVTATVRIEQEYFPVLGHGRQHHYTPGLIVELEVHLVGLKAAFAADQLRDARFSGHDPFARAS